MTQTAQHTPAPWTYQISDNRQSEFEIHCDYCQIGTVERWDGDNDQAVMNEAEANARLIAAAPEMLAALDGIQAQILSLAGESSVIDEDILQGEEYKALVAIIAKATT